MRNAQDLRGERHFSFSEMKKRCLNMMRKRTCGSVHEAEKGYVYNHWVVLITWPEEAMWLSHMLTRRLVWCDYSTQRSRRTALLTTVITGDKTSKHHRQIYLEDHLHVALRFLPSVHLGVKGSSCRLLNSKVAACEVRFSFAFCLSRGNDTCQKYPVCLISCQHGDQTMVGNGGRSSWFIRRNKKHQ